MSHVWHLVCRTVARYLFLTIPSKTDVTQENLFPVTTQRRDHPLLSNSLSTARTTMPGKWFPLESNPQLINKYISKLGFDTSLYEFTDVFSTEDWAMDMIPQPVAAVIMLYPLSEKQERISA